MRLEAIMAELHEFGGVINWERPIRLGLSIQDRDFVRLSAHRGDTLLLDGDILVEFDMGEIGRVVVRDITDRFDVTLRHSESAAPRRILDGNRLVGLAFKRPDDGLFCVWVSGDQFHWGDESKLKDAPFPEGVVPAIGGGLW